MATTPNGDDGTERETVVSIFKEFLQTLKMMSIAMILSIWRFVVPRPCKSVRGEIVLVTGAGSGIGQRIAMEFAKLGAVLVIWDIDEVKNARTADLIKGLSEGVKCHAYRCDVGNRDEVYRTAMLVKQDVGDVAILVNNAGVVSGKTLINTTEHQIQRTLDVNLMAHFWTVKCFLPTMLRRNHGHIVNIASSTGLVGLNKLTDYSTSKFGVVGFTEVLTYEIEFSGYHGVHTTLVCPSFVKTSLFQGCKMRFPWLIPPLEIQPTVDRIMQGILTNQYVVCIPRLIYFFTFLKTVLPVEAFHEIIRFSGASCFMDGFVGQPLDGKGTPHEVTSNGKDTELHSDNYNNSVRPMKTQSRAEVFQKEDIKEKSVLNDVDPVDVVHNVFSESVGSTLCKDTSDTLLLRRCKPE